jgi:hypothetical protein
VDRDAEAGLEQAPLVSLLLRGKVQDLRLQTEALVAELEQDQDPSRLSAIQELIGVSDMPIGRRRRRPSGTTDTLTDAIHVY